jgi:hypothetical protein
LEIGLAYDALKLPPVDPENVEKLICIEVKCIVEKRVELADLFTFYKQSKNLDKKRVVIEKIPPGIDTAYRGNPFKAENFDQIRFDNE